MADFQPTSKQAHTNPPLRLDSAIMVRRSVDMSPIRSSVQSSRVHTPSSSVPSTPITSARAPSPEKKPLHPSDSNTFLTALAAQERRVLELKEELQKAEGELEKLKKQWASHEAAKKRNELRHLEQLQPLKTSLGGPVVPRDNDPIRDLDRRKMAPPPAKYSQRTVFSGSRHARTLSLLSPKHSLADSTLPPRSHGPPKPDRTRAGSTTVPATVHELGNSTDGLNDTDGLYRGPPKDMILETGKQLVGDFRQGLWTFFEDLKQVTVGDEAASASDPRNQPSVPAGSASKTQAKRDKGPNVKKSPAREVENVNGGKMVKSRKMESPQPHPHSLQGSHEPSDIQARPHLESPSISTGHSPHGDTIQNSSDSDDDGWDNWDTTTTKGSTPRRKKAFSTFDPTSSPLTDKSSPRTSTSSVDATPRPKRTSDSSSQQGDLPWPSLAKLSPGRLTRTASTLMSEWEKSLAPPENRGDESPLATGLKDQKAE